MHRLRNVVVLAVATGAVSVPWLREPHARADDPAKPSLEINDISFLFPAPRTQEDVAALISSEEAFGQGTALWPKEAFDRIIELSKEVKVDGERMQLPTALSEDEFEERTTWKVAGIRFDGSAPGSHQPVVDKFGSRPQIRFVLQPVTVEDGEVRVHDIAAHLAYDFLLNPDQVLTQKAEPDEGAFRAILGDLVSLKKQVNESGTATDGKLRVHPGFGSDPSKLTNKVRELLTSHLGGGKLNAISFMGIDAPEPWIFFATRRAGDDYALLNFPFLGGGDAQLIKFIGGHPVVPKPSNLNLVTTGVSTADLFRSLGQEPNPDRVVVSAIDSPDMVDIKARDIPAIVANPAMSFVVNTDCVSCHTETARRLRLNLQYGASRFEFPLGKATSNLDASVTPNGTERQIDWNLRNFGWFPMKSDGRQPFATATHRTANEAAESAAFINQHYFQGEEE
ncbi:MAG TPA: hypothetical protein VGN57_04905 [Pirellulaceae bacterium]|jgi:hypothetical protein|nr:hypothetical protein [Pirellulaceae bacterium]